jgi:hypothetical protein
MTLGQFFEVVSQQPSIVLFYFFALPFTAFLAIIFGCISFFRYILEINSIFVSEPKKYHHDKGTIP